MVLQVGSKKFYTDPYYQWQTKVKKGTLWAELEKSNVKPDSAPPQMVRLLLYAEPEFRYVVVQRELVEPVVAARCGEIVGDGSPD